MTTIDIDEKTWQAFRDDGRVDRAAKSALRQMDWDQPILSTRFARPRGEGPLNPKYAEIWCVKLALGPEVRHYVSLRDSNRKNEDEVISKFAESFAALRNDAVAGG